MCASVLKGLNDRLFMKAKFVPNTGIFLVVLLTAFPKSFHSGFFLELVLLDGFLLIPNWFGLEILSMA